MFQDDETSYKKVKNDYFYQTKKTSPLTGTRVHHSSFGYGRITGVDGDKCEVIFDGYGKKKIMKSFLNFANPDFPSIKYNIRTNRYKMSLLNKKMTGS